MKYTKSVRLILFLYFVYRRWARCTAKNFHSSSERRCGWRDLAIFRKTTRDWKWHSRKVSCSISPTLWRPGKWVIWCLIKYSDIDGTWIKIGRKQKRGNLKIFLARFNPTNIANGNFIRRRKSYRFSRSFTFSLVTYIHSESGILISTCAKCIFEIHPFFFGPAVALCTHHLRNQFAVKKKDHREASNFPYSWVTQRVCLAEREEMRKRRSQGRGSDVVWYFRAKIFRNFSLWNLSLVI